jgi:hypothetical protein
MIPGQRFESAHRLPGQRVVHPHCASIRGTNVTDPGYLPLSESGSLFPPGGPHARGRANHHDPVMPPHLPGGNAGMACLDRQGISALD